MTKKTINLDTVASEFKKWRNKKTNSERIPDALWELVSQIQGHYSRDILCKKLGITVGQMQRNGLVAKLTPPKKSNKVPSFVSMMPNASLACNADTSAVTPSIEIHLAENSG